MTIQLAKEDEDVLARLIESGEFRTPEEAVHHALARLETLENGGSGNKGVFPPGSLLDLYTAEENGNEARLAEVYPKQLEAF